MANIASSAFLLAVIISVNKVSGQYQSCCDSFPSSALCGCNDDIIQCTNLPTPPYIFEKRVCKLVDIRDSHITISRNAFRNIQTDELRLTDCQLNDSMIKPDAFDLLSGTLKTLVLANNSLTRLPSALNHLTNLSSLDVSGNPIKPENFQEDILRNIGDTLLDFQFGSREINAWPKTLTHLPILQGLNLTRATFALLPNDAFHGFQGTLQQLSLKNTKLTSVPLAVAKLRYLQYFSFDDNNNVGDYGMNIPLVSGLMPYLHDVSLQDDNITNFPAIIGTFERLKNLVMDRNNLKFVSDESAHAARRITHLSLRNSGISRIPGALQNITELTDLDLSHNDIHSIERKDLQFLIHLSTLNLNNNPLIYISGDAFTHNGELTTLLLRNTNLTKVPCAVQWMIRVRTPHNSQRNLLVDLTNNKIECNCGLSWIHSMLRISPQASLLVKGDCDTIIKPIQDYIEQDLPECPTFFTCNSR